MRRALLLVGAMLILSDARARPARLTNDADIVSQARVALLSAEEIHGAGVYVDSVDGHVTLYGSVASEDEKRAAEEVVRELRGVESVANHLTVTGMVGPDCAADSEIRNAVENALRSDPVLADSDIRVEEVEDGVARLTGTVSSLADAERALYVAHTVDDVRDVENELRVDGSEAAGSLNR